MSDTGHSSQENLSCLEQVGVRERGRILFHLDSRASFETSMGGPMLGQGPPPSKEPQDL